MQGKEKERLIVTLHYTFLFKRSIFLFVRRGDGKQSWYLFFFCFYVIKTTTSMVIQRMTIMVRKRKEGLQSSAFFFALACAVLFFSMHARKTKKALDCKPSFLFLTMIVTEKIKPLWGDNESEKLTKGTKRFLT